MSALPTHFLQLLTAYQSPMEYYSARLAADASFIILLWLAVKTCIVFRLRYSAWNRSSGFILDQELLKSRGTCTTADTFGSSKPNVENLHRESRIDTVLRLLSMMLLMAISLLLIWGHLPFAFSLQGGLHFPAQSSSGTPQLTGLQNVFQVSQPISFDSSGSNNPGVETPLMDYVFGASYGALVVGKKEIAKHTLSRGLISKSTQEIESFKLTVSIYLTVTYWGRQYDRLAIMYLGDNEVFRPSIAEPTSPFPVRAIIHPVNSASWLRQSPNGVCFIREWFRVQGTGSAESRNGPVKH